MYNPKNPVAYLLAQHFVIAFTTCFHCTIYQRVECVIIITMMPSNPVMELLFACTVDLKCLNAENYEH